MGDASASAACAAPSGLGGGLMIQSPSLSISTSVRKGGSAKATSSRGMIYNDQQKSTSTFARGLGRSGVGSGAPTILCQSDAAPGAT